MTAAEHLLAAARSVVIVDWPSRDVPDTLARAGLAVFVKGGPEPDNYNATEWRDGELLVTRVGQPQHADLVYSHRPIDELPGIVALAQSVGAKAIWCQSGLTSSGVNDPKGCWVPADESREARAVVEAAGLAFIDDTYIADAARHLGSDQR